MVNVKIITVKDEPYKNFVSCCPYARLQHTPAYLASLQSFGEDDIYLFAAYEEDRLTAAIPVSIRNGPAGKILNSLPYAAGYGGILYNPGKDMGAQVLFKEVLQWARQERCIAATFCTPPFGIEKEWYDKIEPPTAYIENFYQYQSLAKNLLNGVSAKRRSAIKNELKKASQSGLQLYYQSENDLFDEWYENIYVSRFKDIGAKPLTRQFIQTLVKTFCPRNCELVYALLDGQLIAGTMFTYFNGVLDYYATASLEVGFKLFAPSWIISTFVDWAIEQNGCQWLNWQSSPTHSGGVYHFKKRWGAIEGVHHYLSYALGDIDQLLDAPLKVKSSYPNYFVWPISL